MKPLDRTAIESTLLAEADADPAAPAAALSAELAALAALDHDGLVARWRKSPAGRPGPAEVAALPPPRLPAADGGLWRSRSRGAARFLKRIVRDRDRRRAEGSNRPAKAPLPVPPVPVERSPKPGAGLVRSHGGTVHRVMVMPDGFAWSGDIWRSLSEIGR